MKKMKKDTGTCAETLLNKFTGAIPLSFADQDRMPVVTSVTAIYSNINKFSGKHIWLAIQTSVEETFMA